MATNTAGEASPKLAKEDTGAEEHARQTDCTVEQARQTDCTVEQARQADCTVEQARQTDCTVEHARQTDCTEEHAIQTDCTVEQHCKYCGKQSNKMRFCTGCWKVKYCNKKCQTSDWRQHRLDCQASQSQGKDFKESEQNTDNEETTSMTTNTSSESFFSPNTKTYTSPKVPAQNFACSHCGKRSDSLKCCTRCWITLYCDKNCQKHHWKTHKTECKADANQGFFVKNLLLPRLLLSVLWSEFARGKNGEREMEFLLDEDIGNTHEACQLLKRRCARHPGHKEFIPVAELTMDHLPPYWRTSTWLSNIKDMANLTVKLTVDCISPNRPDYMAFRNLTGSRFIRTASGWLNKGHIRNILKTQPCPIQNCSADRGPHAVSGYFDIYTAAHVVFDNSEAEKTVVEFFYHDDRDTRTVVRARGVKVRSLDVDADRCTISCIAHEYEKLHRCLTEPEETYTNDLSGPPSVPYSSLGYLVSHPHGCSKQITFGNLKSTQILMEKSKEEVETSLMSMGAIELVPFLHREYSCVFQYDIPTCPGCSGAPIRAFAIQDGKVLSHRGLHSRRIAEHVNECGAGILTEFT